ncbi:MAG: YebC/PmpR family DNA-binding transcriptional regulator, partial [Parasporobacterium sp.]|nr:YebC/PmpR family DNA-binding transcriptional regulator [Parasporobacterium sp.]
KKGQIIIDKEEYECDADELMMTALDVGAEDFAEEEDSYTILTDPDEFSKVREELEGLGIPMADAQVSMIPQTYVDLSDEEDIKNMNKILEMLDDDDDVQDVYHNWNE